ncbi:MAG: sigma-70 family RNA polymerase sigma factor [Planctomycetales bacterium]|nr:sigma-70 family RNA polymerase sigma factor [Planctomycetales bacterium]
MPTDQFREIETSQSDALDWLAEHGDTLLSYAAARVADLATAEDLVQETFLAAVIARHHFRGESATETWLVGILRRRIADHYRMLSRRPKGVCLDESRMSEKVIDQGATRANSGTILGVGDYESEEFRSALDECLQRLPSTLAGVFVLRVLDGLEVGELCDMFQVSRGNLRVRLHRARAGLRDCLSRTWL